MSLIHYFVLLILGTVHTAAQVHCPFEFSAILSLGSTLGNITSSNNRIAIASAPRVTKLTISLGFYNRNITTPRSYPHYYGYLLPIDAYHPHTPGVIQRINTMYNHIVMYHVPGAEPPQPDPQFEVFEYTPQDLPQFPMTQFGGKSPSASAPYRCPGLDPNDEASLLLYKYGFIPYEVQGGRSLVYNIVVDQEIGRRLSDEVNRNGGLSFQLFYDRLPENVWLNYPESMEWMDGYHVLTENDTWTSAMLAMGLGSAAGVVVLLACCIGCCCCYHKSKKRERQRRLQEQEQEQQQGEILLSETPNVARRIAQQRRRGHLERPIRRGLDDLSHLDVMAYAEYVVLCGEATNISKAADCAICIEHFENENEVRVLPCLHPFHLRCIDPWLTAHSAACPLCKQEARSKDS